MTEGRRLDFVDAARGWAILGVIAVHASQWTPNLSAVCLSVLGCGQYGVQLFFVASAFTLALTWEQRSSAAPSSKLDFWIRRLFRVGPMYWAGILLYLGMAMVLSKGAWPEGWALEKIVLHGLLAHGWSPVLINDVVPGGWSIGVEVSFYLLFPFAIPMVRTLKRTFIAVIATIGFSLAANGLGGLVLEGAWRTEILNNTFWYWWLPSQLPVFALGLLAYRLWPIELSESSWFSKALTALAFAIFAGVGYSMTKAAGSAHFAAWLFGAAAAAFLLLLASGTAGWLTARPIMWVGRISYSLYILHAAAGALFILWALPRLLPLAQLPGSVNFVCVMIVLLAVTIPLAWVAHQLLEKPGIAAGRALIRQRQQRLVRRNSSALSAKEAAP